MGFYVCGLDSALIKSGAGLAKPVIITGGYFWAWPCCQMVRNTLSQKIRISDFEEIQYFTWNDS